MPTNFEDTGNFGNWESLRKLHTGAVRDSASLVSRVSPADLARPTPCSAWTLTELLVHMTAQHRGFAAAVNGHGQDPANWSHHPLGEDFAADYRHASDEAIAAFAAVDRPDRACVLPEVTEARTFPAVQVLGFHLIDYVVHGWDVARTLDLPFDPDPDVLRAALPIAGAVPQGDHRLAPGSAFRPALATDGDASTLDRILTTLGRSPSWHATPPARGEVPRDR
ncbi:MULTISPECIES: TIGR03086 family metal-binding protein [unclassified Streptomyces]|uniref:TIGR03086 family metal-binding protein n=1 Tax=unclassified Streptomyces TaxID=2593676 RepID=UPI002E13BBCA|nr:TIGR03086 family metal-binding protein [Streptomyces sp. NBC_01197]WSS49259.1 TIGR03086 family metal-binding protein [Streptomyces sp. NBC_01180]